MDLIINPKIIGTNFKIIDLLVYIIFIKKHSTGKVVKVFSNLIRNMVISLNKSTGFVIIIVGSIKKYILLKIY